MKKNFILFTLFIVSLYSTIYSEFFIINNTIIKGKILYANEFQCQIEVNGQVKKFPTNLVSNIGNNINDLLKNGILLKNNIKIYGNYSIFEVKKDIITFKSTDSVLNININDLISYSNSKNNENIIYIKKSVINYNKLNLNIEKGIISTNFGSISMDFNDLTKFEIGKYLISAEGLLYFLNSLKKEKNKFISSELNFTFDKIYSIINLKENKQIYEKENPYLVFKLPYNLKIENIIYSENSMYILGKDNLYIYDIHGFIKKIINVKYNTSIRIIDSHLIIFSDKKISFYDKKTLKLEKSLSLNFDKYINKIIEPLSNDTYLFGTLIDKNLFLYNFKKNNITFLNLNYIPHKIINNKDEKILLELNKIIFLNNNLEKIREINKEASLKNKIVFQNNKLYYFYTKINCYNKEKLLYSFDPKIDYRRNFLDNKDNLYLISKNTIKKFYFGKELWKKTFKEYIVDSFSTTNGIYVLFKNKYIVLNNTGKIIKTEYLKYKIDKFYGIIKDFIIYKQNNSLIFVKTNFLLNSWSIDNHYINKFHNAK
ncbi:hypothetical protein OSSY52_08430 [Tepiditoga spiralis]|uniref:Uncharacterized protein n=1 Tax=Tepiditoga spiralis TaxID=2108365 RepID=A0A7G1G9H4_9BACT|nr:hypothetical protein [Tepiditoga spiralis]BBE30702.1 hypothetical protein OSSY52_08430 [Tepiditoga spiralis]